MDEELTQEDLDWLNNPFTKEDLEHIEQTKPISTFLKQQKREI